MQEKWTPQTHPQWFDPKIKTPKWDRFKKALEKEIKRLKDKNEPMDLD